jgi:acetyl esterase/lipase
MAQGIRPEKVASIGHSIGGNLAVSLAIAMRDRGRPLPGAVLTVSGWFDPRLTNSTVDGNAEGDRLLSRPLLEFFRESWLGGTAVAFEDPRVNLLLADLTGLPPIRVYYGAFELLAGEAIAFADRARRAGVDVSLRCLPEGQHPFILAAGRVPEVDETIDDMGAWLRERLQVEHD